MNEQMELVDVLGVPDTFVSGLGSVEAVGGGNYRFTMYVDQLIDGQTVHVVVAKMIASVESVPISMHMAAAATKTCACQNVRAMARN